MARSYRIGICGSCLEEKPILARGLCRLCYGRKHREHYQRPQGNCAKCGRLKQVHERLPDGSCLCGTCQNQQRETKTEICSGCGRDRRICSRRNGNLCSLCYEAERQCLPCSSCGELSRLAVSNPALCHRCYNKEYCQRPEVVAKRSAAKSRRGAQEASGDFTVADWLLVMRDWCWRCAYCGETLSSSTRSIDHVVPLSRNGRNSRDNIVACCRRCNSRKHDRFLSEWLPHAEHSEVVDRMTKVAGGTDPWL
jgi:5-methylcytosine-specific restriction endonuclease McrA